MKVFSYLMICYALFLCTPAASLHAQGFLAPPGPPAQTMKTLQQVEPRIDILTVGDDGDVHHLIQAPGSYYLTADLLVSKANGVRVSANDVTIDLNGFSIRRSGAAGGSIGIVIPATMQNVRIRNGSVRGFDIGIRGQDNPGGFAVYSQGATLQDLAVVGCTGTGVQAGDNWHLDNCRITNGGRAIDAGSKTLIRNCLVADNTSSSLIVAVSSYSSVLDTIITNNAGVVALNTGSNTSVARCNISGNRSTGSTFAGIFHSGRGSIIDCIISNNIASGGASNSSGLGIHANSESLISRCTITGNKGDGIRTYGACVVTGNSIAANGTSGGDGAGINIDSGSGTRVEGNHIVGNDRGLDINTTGNVIRENTVQGNTDNYDIIAGNEVEILLSQLPETIDVPAMVKLAGALTGVANQPGITVTANNVTIDLGGHTLTGVANSLDGIAGSNAADLTVRNGTLVSWGGAGIATGTRATVEKVMVRHVGGGGILTGTLAQVRECLVYISGGDGISLGETSRAERCLVNSASGHGLVLSNHCVARENSCDSQNGAGKAGIYVSGARNHVEANTCTRNNTHFLIAGQNNLVIRNSASSAAPGGYFNVTGSFNSVGPSVNSTNIASNTNPHANYEY